MTHRSRLLTACLIALGIFALCGASYALGWLMLQTLGMHGAAVGVGVLASVGFGAFFYFTAK